ncbi:MAG: PEGA domain-containing protein [Verrucomicrobia bacterium]|nr:MAG: PEGA domain-containing protein [Verrucomicrobiota bacterium]
MKARVPHNVWLAIGLWLTSGAAQGFFGSGAQLRVTSVPAGAQVMLDNQAQDITPLTLQGIHPGQHLLEIRKDGYQPLRRTLALLAGEKTAVEFKLEPVKGLVLVHTAPPGVEVDIDGAYRGKTPLLLTDLALGDHQVVLRTEGFQPRTLPLKIADRTPIKLRTDLASDSAKLNIVSDPTNAVVTLNGASRGTTPCVVERIPGGTVELEIGLKGFAPYRDRIVLKAGDVVDVRAQLKAVPAALAVTTIPEKARIYVNNQYKGDAPIALTNLPPGEYRLRAELRGYEADARTITLKPEDQTTEEFRLQRNNGGLVIISEPAGAQIYVDDDLVGTTQPLATNPQVSEPLRVGSIARGDHWLKLVKPGFTHTPSKFMIDTDRLITRTERMTRLFIPDTIVRTGTTADESYTGVFVRKYPNGDVEMELRPGIIKRFPANTIRFLGPINAPQK